jgi:quinol monooxygenase YgiN
MIHVVAIITTKPSLRAEVLSHFRAIVPAVCAETGCIEYDATIDALADGGCQTALGPDTFVVIQKWERIEAFRAHGSAPHSLAYDTKVRGNLAVRDIHVLSPG